MTNGYLYTGLLALAAVATIATSTFDVWEKIQKIGWVKHYNNTSDSVAPVKSKAHNKTNPSSEKSKSSQSAPVGSHQALEAPNANNTSANQRIYNSGFTKIDPSKNKIDAASDKSSVLKSSGDENQAPSQLAWSSEVFQAEVDHLLTCQVDDPPIGCLFQGTE